MDEQTNELTWEPYVWRGALGGTLGMLGVVAVAMAYVLLRFGSDSLIEPFVIMGVMGLVSGVITGLAIGYVIYKVAQRRGAEPTHAWRIAIGIAAVLAYELLTGLTSNRPFHPTFVVGYAVAVGGLAGFLSRARPSASTNISQTRA
ncbi:MAG TPA: hypothetical protein VE863_13415 [Pyrinomonadaceae bacterium]|nr:hypothetical protein [Pyrinomonadaceae bacterium]